MQELLLLLYANNFYNLANYILLLLLALLIWKKGGEFDAPLDDTFSVLLMASISYILIYIRNYGMPSSSMLFLRAIAPGIMYYYGASIAGDGIQRLKTCILFISGGSFLHGFGNIIKNRNVDFLQIHGRYYNDIYGGTVSGTLQSLFFIVACSLLFYFIFNEMNRLLKVGGVICVIIAMYGSIKNASRTLLLVTALIFFAAMLFYLYEKFGFLTAGMYFGGILLAIVLTVGISIKLNLFHVQELYAKSAIAQRSAMYGSNSNSLTQNSRWTYAKDVLRLLPSHLFGNKSYPYFAHNLWVDIAREAGIIPFVLYIRYILLALNHGIQILKTDKVEVFDKIFFATTVLGYFLIFFTEPVIQGSPISFSIFCFIVGGISSLMLQLEEEEEEAAEEAVEEAVEEEAEEE